MLGACIICRVSRELPLTFLQEHMYVVHQTVFAQQGLHCQLLKELSAHETSHYYNVHGMHGK